jgi:xanthine phosphoribosyltransferase
MKLLEDRIRQEGRVLPGGIIKVDGFLNHRVDPALMRALAAELHRVFPEDITAILTCKASGIALGEACAEMMKA